MKSQQIKHCEIPIADFPESPVRAKTGTSLMKTATSGIDKHGWLTCGYPSTALNTTGFT